MCNSCNRERTITAEVSAALIGCQQRVSPPVPEEGRDFAQRGKSVDSRNHTQAKWQVSAHLPSYWTCPASYSGTWTKQELSRYLTVTLVHAEEGGWCFSSSSLVCVSELLQVWDMAATETQLMLSVGLIGKFHFTGRFLSFFFLVFNFFWWVFKRIFQASASVNVQENHMIPVWPKSVSSAGLHAPHWSISPALNASNDTEPHVMKICLSVHLLIC